MGHEERVLDDRTRTTLSQKFRTEMFSPVEIVFLKGLGNEKYGRWSERLLNELAEISDQILVRTHDLVQRTDLIERYEVVTTPTILLSPEEGYRIRYSGGPMGYEAWGFIETIVLVSKGDSGLAFKSREVAKRILDLGRRMKVTVFVTPSCPYCPQQVLLTNKLAVEARGALEAECVEALENPNLANQFSVSAVPHSVILVRESKKWAPRRSFVGMQSEERFIEEVLAAVQ